MRIKKIVRIIHLWLGLLSGLLVFFLGITGCLLAFEIEVRTVTEPYRRVEPRIASYAAPGELRKIAEQYLQSKNAITIEYPGRNRAAIASYYDEEHYEIVFLDPYTGRFLKHRNMNRDFFRIIINGHYYLWLPPRIGQPIVASATLVFFIMLISGIILWWPKNKAAMRQRFTIKWSARWRRKNYDLHNVLGFYMSWIGIFLAVTGLVMGFQWFARSVYWTASGGKQMPAYETVLSDTLKHTAGTQQDRIFFNALRDVRSDESIAIYFPASPADAVQLTINHRPGTYYKTDNLYFDQYTGIQATVNSTYQGYYRDSAIADKIARMNYDIHVGAILGLPGKILVFFASLVAASLPVTGFLLWWGRRKKYRPQAMVSQKASGQVER